MTGIMTTRKDLFKCFRRLLIIILSIPRECLKKVPCCPIYGRHVVQAVSRIERRIVLLRYAPLTDINNWIIFVAILLSLYSPLFS